MKLGEAEFNFGRMLKVILWQPQGSGSGPGDGRVAYELEFNPMLSPDKVARMEATVTDLPSADQDDKPGFSADVTIYNPDDDLLTLIARNAKWLLNAQEVEQMNGASLEKVRQVVQTNIKDYYNSRLRISIYAGYYTGTSGGETLGYKNIFTGYVNETSFFRRAQDNILIIRAHDINIDSMDRKALTNTALQLINQTADEVLEMVEEAELQFNGYYSWDKTFKKFVVSFAPGAETVYSGSGVPMTLLQPDTPNDAEYVSLFDQFYKVYYVTSPNAFEQLHAAKLSDIKPSVIDTQLKNQMESPYWWSQAGMPALPNKEGVFGGASGTPDWSKYRGHGATRGRALNDLCSFSNARVAYRVYKEPIDNKIIYLVYRISTANTKPVRGEYANVQIFNFQNLLETPSVAGNGQMSVKMFFNPDCHCHATLALMLDDRYNGVVGYADISKVLRKDQNGNYIGSLASSSGAGQFHPLTQLSGTQSVNALRSQSNEWLKAGYMFNTGFVIINVVHKLTTHDSAWTTEVKTTPMIRGILIGEGKTK